MTDDPRLTPEQDAVRRLLADARHTGPPPAEVVGRLEETLAALVAERGSRPLTTDTPRMAPVVDLSARRRRIAGIGVLAAAAVVVAGVAVGQVLPRGAGDSSTGAASVPDSAAAGSPSELDAGDAGAAELAPEAMKSAVPAPYAGAPSLASDDPLLEQQVLDLRTEAAPRDRALADEINALQGCVRPMLGPGRSLQAQVDGEPGIVMYRPAQGSVQVVDLYACSESFPVHTVILPAP